VFPVSEEGKNKLWSIQSVSWRRFKPGIAGFWIRSAVP